MNNSPTPLRARLHWKNRKSYALVIPPAFLQGIFNFFPRTNQVCTIHPTQSENGKPAIIVEFE